MSTGAGAGGSVASCATQAASSGGALMRCGGGLSIVVTLRKVKRAGAEQEVRRYERR